MQNTFLPKIDKKANIEQIVYCLENFEKLDWKDLITRSREYLTKEYEFGGRCQIDLETSQVKVSIEVTQQRKSNVNQSSTHSYGPISWHTHPSNGGSPFPSYPDLMNVLRRVRMRDILWYIIISKDMSGNPCLVLYRPNDDVLMVIQEKQDITTHFRYFCKILSSIDKIQHSLGSYHLAIAKYFEFKQIGIPREDKRVRVLGKQLRCFKNVLHIEPYKILKKTVRQMPRRIKIGKVIKAKFMISLGIATLIIIQRVITTK